MCINIKYIDLFNAWGQCWSFEGAAAVSVLGGVHHVWCRPHQPSSGGHVPYKAGAGCSMAMLHAR